MDDVYYRQLVQRYLSNQANAEELEIFADLLRKGKIKPYLEEAMNAEAGINLGDEQAYKRVAPVRQLQTAWVKYAAAAILLMCLSAALYFTNHSEINQKVSTVTTKPNDILPGGNKAILTLSNGRQIALTGHPTGLVANQGTAAVTQKTAGSITYMPNANDGVTPELLYNTVSTPKAGHYQVVLPDGTQVWLNALSSIRFPVSFSGSERRVSITGEVYMEVAKNKEKPFFVESAGQTIRVLGTHFNINAYIDEKATVTTLLEGRIKISSGSSKQDLMPGDQVTLSNGQFTLEPTSDADAAIAWKNGLFKFNKTDLPTLMRQLSRWYDVDIVYQGATPRHKFVGEIKRSNKLSKVLEMLETSGVKFKIEDKTLYIHQASENP